MPIYDYVCSHDSDHVITVLESYNASEGPEVVRCHQKMDCGGIMIKQVGITSKVFVNDSDLIKARTHDGKK